MRALQGWINGSRRVPLSGAGGFSGFFLDHTAFCHPLLRIALIATAGLAGIPSADAAVFWSDDDDPGVMAPPPPPVQQRRPRMPRRAGPKADAHLKEATRPVGPLVIAISIDRQMLKIYDANGLYAESPVSTGMRGHSTPMGVFSVIQKQKWHQSNIYSGAPMPFMQRITWSGIAMHAGVLPGYPASHGCIRMPAAFAVKMYGWTRAGARVVITPGEISPSDFSHPLLALQKPVPVPAAPAAPAKDATKDVAATTKTDKMASNTDQPARSSVGLELKPSVEINPAKGAPDQTRTADAGNIVIASSRPSTMTDAQPSMSKIDDKPAAVKAVTATPADIITPETSRPEASKDMPAHVAAPVIDATKPADDAATSITGDVRKDQARPDDPAQATTPATTTAAAPAPAPKRGQIAAFVSRKDGKLYVRQDFAPLFDVPVTIAPSDRPLGTHVFTARADKDVPGTFRWSVISLPVGPSRTARDDEGGRTSRRSKAAGAIEVTSAPLPDSPTEALDRLTIPADAMARIAESIATGGSLIVSDLGIASGGETGEGTEFVVPLR